MVPLKVGSDVGSSVGLKVGSEVGSSVGLKIFTGFISRYLLQIILLLMACHTPKESNLILHMPDAKSVELEILGHRRGINVRCAKHPFILIPALRYTTLSSTMSIPIEHNNLRPIHTNVNYNYSNT